MSGGPSYAAGLELSGASPISEEERAREAERFERAQRDATEQAAGFARDEDDFYELCEAMDVAASRPVLAEVRAGIRERRKARTKGRRR